MQRSCVKARNNTRERAPAIVTVGASPVQKSSLSIHPRHCRVSTWIQEKSPLIVCLSPSRSLSKVDAERRRGCLVCVEGNVNMAEVINECVSACRKMLLLPHLKVKTALSCHDKSVIGKPLKVFALRLHLSHRPSNNSLVGALQLNPHPDFTDGFHLFQ